MSRWELQRDPSYYQREPEMIQLAATSYDQFDADRRFEIELDRDRLYLWTMLAVLFVAALAGTSLGRINRPSAEAFIPVLLYAIVALGVACIVTFRHAILTRAEVSEGTNLVAQAALAGLGIFYFVLPAWLAGLLNLHAVIGFSALLLVIGVCLGFNRLTRWPSYILTALLFPIYLVLQAPSAIVLERVLAGAVAVSVLFILVAGARRVGYRLQPAGLVVQLALVTACARGLQGLFGSAVVADLAMLVTAAGVVGLFVWLQRRDFAAVAIAVILVQLGGVAFAPEVSYLGLRTQLAAGSIEILLLCVIALRIRSARIAGMPPGNFLRSPSCHIPLLEQAQGFALESDVAP